MQPLVFSRGGLNMNWRKIIHSVQTSGDIIAAFTVSSPCSLVAHFNTRELKDAE